MAKKEDVLFQEWKKELQKDIESIEDAETKAAWTKVLASDEATARKVMKGGMRESDYYRKLNDIHAERTQDEKTRSEWKSWYEKAKSAEQALKSEATKHREEAELLKKELAKREAAFRDLNMDDEADEVREQRMKVSDEMGRKEFEDLKRQTQEAALEAKAAREDAMKLSAATPAFAAALVKQATKLAKEGYDFDSEVVIQEALQKNLTLEQAFDSHIAPQKAEKEEKRFKEAIEKAKEEARQEVLTKQHAPDSMRPTSGFWASHGSKGDPIKEAREANLADVHKFLRG